MPYKKIGKEFYLTQLIRNKIPLVISNQLYDYRSENLDTNAIFNNLGNKISSHYNSVLSFGENSGVIEKAVIPITLPFRVRYCIHKLNANRFLQAIDENTYDGKHNYVTIQASDDFSALKFTIIDTKNCLDSVRFDLVPYSIGWLKISTSNFPIAFSSPGRTINLYGNTFLISSPQGEFYTFDLDKHEYKLLTKISVNPPITFSKSDLYSGAGIKSLLIHDGKIYLSAVQVYSNCAFLEVYESTLDTPLHFNFKKIYSSACSRVNIKSMNDKLISSFSAMGGRLVVLTNDLIGLSFGNGEIWKGNEAIASNPKLGIIVSINTKSYVSNIISSGHRNVQGLCVYNKMLYATEQGSQGGDELNKIIPGKDYGWPKNSYGRPYGDIIYKGERIFGDHPYGEMPIFSWLPSLAVSPLLCPDGNFHEYLRNSFWIGTLKDKSIHRVSIISNRVVYDEKINLGSRIRELMYSNKSNEIIAFTDDNQFKQIQFIID